MIAERGGEMSAGGESERSHARRIHARLGGMRADQPDGALRILERLDFARSAALHRNAILQKHAGDADRI